MHRLGGRARLKCPDVFGELRRDAGDECVLVYSGRPRGHRLVGALNGISGQGRVRHDPLEELVGLVVLHPPD
jgi:hypothetical protein